MQHIPRIYLPSYPSNGPVKLEGDSAHHLVKVIRAEPGDEVRVFSGDGREWRARVTSVERGHALLALESIVAQEPAPLLVCEVWCGIIRPQRFDWMVEKVTEAGADIIRPFTCKRTGATREASKTRMERWERIAVEASEQCGRLRIPVIQPPAAFERLVEGYRDAWVIGDRAGMSWAQVERLLPSQGHVALAVGPEGGFTDEELRLARVKGALSLRLGRNTLRTETAALVGTALLAGRA